MPPFSRWANVYIGWGQKELQEGFRPPLLPGLQEEFDDASEELQEGDDPSREEEEAWMAAQAELAAENDHDGDPDDADHDDDDMDETESEEDD